MAEASDDHKKSVADKMNDAIHQFFAENEDSMVVKWMVQAEVIDNDGEEALWTIESTNMSIWDQLGMLEYMKMNRAAKIAAAHRDD